MLPIRLIVEEIYATEVSCGWVIVVDLKLFFEKGITTPSRLKSCVCICVVWVHSAKNLLLMRKDLFSKSCVQSIRVLLNIFPPGFKI